MTNPKGLLTMALWLLLIFSAQSLPAQNLVDQNDNRKVLQENFAMNSGMIHSTGYRSNAASLLNRDKLSDVNFTKQLPRIQSAPLNNNIYWMLGFTGGFSAPSYILSAADNEIKDSKAINGYSVGITLEAIPANTNGFSFLVALMYDEIGGGIIDEGLSPTYAGILEDGATYRYWADKKETLRYVSVPVLVKYTGPGKIGIQAVAGLKFSSGQSGEFQINLKDENGKTRDPVTQEPYNVIYAKIAEGEGKRFKSEGEIDFGKIADDDVYKPIAISMMVGFGLALNMDSGNVISLRADYNRGLTNIFNDNNDLNVRKHTALAVNLGFSFLIGQ